MSGTVRVIARADDFGHAQANVLAVEKGHREGIITCASIMMCSPWAEEAAWRGSQMPKLSLGVHLMLTGEWRRFRVRPLLGADKVPSLVDGEGFFHQSNQAVKEANPDPDQVRAELKAQISLAKKWKVKLRYLDYHMSAVTQDPVLHQLAKDLGREEGLPMSEDSGGPGSLGEYADFNKMIYPTPPAEKTAHLRKILGELEPGTWMLYFHLMIDSPEARSIAEGGLPDGGTLSDVWKHRSAELAAVTDSGVKKVIQDRGIQLLGY